MTQQTKTIPVRTLDSDDLFDIDCHCGKRSVLYLFDCYHTFRCPGCCFPFWMSDGELCKAARALAALAGNSDQARDRLRDNLTDLIRAYCTGGTLRALTFPQYDPVEVSISSTISGSSKAVLEGFQRVVDKLPRKP